MKTDRYLRVLYKGRNVGTLAMTPEKKVAFEYGDEWLENGFSISPFSLPLKKQVFLPQKSCFQGLFGVFADSLPDAWGNLLLDRFLKKSGVNPDRVNVLERLAIVGSSGMGALTYEPEFKIIGGRTELDLDDLADQCQKILRMEYAEDLDELYRMGGTSGGARPKIMTEWNGEDWIIKFPAHTDRPDMGKMEYDYSLCAYGCGIDVPETRLFPSKKSQGFFGTKRFDRVHREGERDVDRVHMLTVAALLELDFRQPSLDYHSLMKLTKILTRNNRADMENMFRRMCFNVFAHNRDDHSKNFTFLYHESQDSWRLSPAYDLTYSTTYYGEHTTTVDGEGAAPGRKELAAVGIKGGISKKRCGEMMDEVQECVNQMLREYI